MGAGFSWLGELMNSNLGILIGSVGGAMAVLYNIHSGICLVNRFIECHTAEEAQAEDEGSPQAVDEGDEYMEEDLTTGLDYGHVNGPHAWNTATNNQSPINIDTNNVEAVCIGLSLIWIGYDTLPLGIRLENNGHTLLLRAAFEGDTPRIDGADLIKCFKFHEISFRWSWQSLGTGSEHTLDNEHFPLEMQCLHADTNSPENTSSRSLLVISYMFTVSAENPFLDVLVRYLVAVQLAGQCVEIPPFPLNYLMPPFFTEFYSYHGSLTEPPCHRGAEWFINPLPLAISERQLHEFRKLRSRSGARIGRNARPVQELGDRRVKFNYYAPIRQDMA